jgi:peroxiredoxin Q/BCP
MLRPGDRAPDFHLKTDDGGELSLKDLKGKRAVLFFFPKANTTG